MIDHIPGLTCLALWIIAGCAVIATTILSIIFTAMAQIGNDIMKEKQSKHEHS